MQVGLQQVNVRVVGLVEMWMTSGKIVIKTQNGTPLRISDIATVEQGTKIRLGRVGKAIHRADGKIIDDDDVVMGSVFLRKGANAETTLKAIHKKVAGAQRPHSAAGRKGRAVSGPQRPDSLHHAHRAAEPGARALSWWPSCCSFFSEMPAAP